jgi:epoxyqueuosine reductase
MPVFPRTDSLTNKLKAEAKRLGFDFVGVTKPAPPAHYARYTNWLAQGHHAKMEYLATERAQHRRFDPRHILPLCESILVLGASYAHPGPHAPAPIGHGKIASYAWGDDYHNVLPERMQALVTFLEQETGAPVPNRWYTDTGPILERELAQQAGLGWVGKNGCLIHPQAGSTFFIAEILLGISLDADQPFSTDHCGTCTRCLEACPTECILPDRTLDANRCISYLTIENKGEIPIKLRPKIEDWAFGCDICQQVCPWTIRFGANPTFDAFQSRFPVPAALTEELALTPQAFNRKFKHHPVKRAKRRGYLRNVCVVLGNQRDTSAVGALIAALHDFEPLIRGHAAWALGQIGTPDALGALEIALQGETDPVVRREIQDAQNSAQR